MRPRLLRGHWKRIESLLKLKREAEQDGAYRIAKRIHAVVLNMEGDTSTAIAESLKASRSKISLWLQQYAAQGVEGLLEGHRSGHPCALTPPQLGTLADILDSGPVVYGSMSGVWTSPMIGRVIQEEFGVEYHPGHVRKLLYRLEFYVQRPKRLLARADERQQSRWRRYLYPRIKKSL